MTTEILVQAGRAGRDAYREVYLVPERKDDDSLLDVADAANAQAVLESLGIEWTGEWAWGVTWVGISHTYDTVTEEDARTMLKFLRESDPDEEFILQRRPKVNTLWRDEE